MCRGAATKAIARELGISQQAVKAHIAHLFGKFDVVNRAGLVAAAFADAHDAADAARDSDIAAMRERERANTEAREDLERTNRELVHSVRDLAADNADLKRENERLRAQRGLARLSPSGPRQRRHDGHPRAHAS